VLGEVTIRFLWNDPLSQDHILIDPLSLVLAKLPLVLSQLVLSS
jgi:hypothetical protein